MTSLSLRRRSTAAVAAGVTVLLAASACGSSDDGGSDASSEAGSTYTIGVLNSTTGALGAVGQQEAQGMDLAVAEINAAGGIDGHPIKLTTVDDQGAVNQTTAGFKKLATSDKVPVIIGPGISAGAAAVAPLADQYGVTHVLLVAQPQYANGTKNVFEVPPPGTSNSQAEVEYAQQAGAKTAAIIYANNPYGQQGNTDLTAAAEKAGITITSSESWDPSAFNFTAQAGKVAAAKPDAVFLGGAGGTSDGLLLKAVRDAGYTGKVIGDLSYASSEIPSAAKDAANTVVGLAPVDYGKPTALQQAVIKAYGEKYDGAAPTVLAVYGYTAVKLVAEAIKKAGKFESEAISTAMIGLNYESPVGTLAYTDDYHAGPDANAFSPVTFKDGKYAPVEG